ncbi:NAD(P)-dependent oxidoreductase [Lentzea nigeriaca]|uniref:NAD(P)-dependent oxidoreductase n=1 Tax=Lentzea nigeriaca TaxID=1128665 RepID=UPI00195DDD11|nr:NAD(P)H-binding protein [Lentzea nigeriaca]MBM7856336.1 putative NADH-flavin reductase [Lentzea nigeriaca]
MKLAVFGATGGTGVELLRQALDAGHEVVALARDPGAVPVRHDRLHVRRGDVHDPDSVVGVVDGTAAVVSALGIGYRRHATTVYSAGTGNVIAAMRDAGVSRLLAVSTSSVRLPPRSRFAEYALARFVLHPLLKRPYADMRLMEQEVRASGLEWTLVRAARLTNGRRTGRYRVASDLPGCWSISRADVAHYMLTRLTDAATFRSAVQIAY